MSNALLARIFSLSFGVLVLAGPLPCHAQTVIHDSAPAAPAPGAPGRAMADTLRGRGDAYPRPGPPRPDTAARPSRPEPPPKPAAAVPLGPPLPRGVCPAAADRVSADVLLVTFRSRSTPAEREAAVKRVKGTIVAPDPNDPASAYVRVPSEGNEFRLRVIADRLIRAPVVKEVGSVQCPAAQ
jgi:hypothetical protein